MSATDFFPTDYGAARRTFRHAANVAGARLHAYPLDAAGREGEKLTIDVAIIGDADPDRVMLVSSGIHGVEGFFGSALQTAWLRKWNECKWARGTAIVLIHALNPYGFSWLRRVNEDNVDLNRNFLRFNERYEGAPPGYAELDGFLNPATAPSPLEMYRFQALWQILRRGMPALKSAVAVGQYEFQRGLFFGGHGPSQSTRIIQAHCSEWVSSAADIVHIDLHTGLGASGTYKLLILDAADSPSSDWYRRHFGDEIESTASSSGTAYPARGMIGGWLADHWRDLRYRYMAAEFGTVPIIRVLGAMRAENRAHYYLAPGHKAYLRAKSQLLECFCPRSYAWRGEVLDKGLRIMRDAVGALSG